MKIEYDDDNGDGNGNDNDYQSQDYNYSSDAQKNETLNKRKYGNGQATNDDDNDAISGDDMENPANGESSTNSSSETVPKKKRRKEFLNLNATFMAGVQGVQLVTDTVRVCLRYVPFFYLQKISWKNVWLFIFTFIHCSRE